jgi:hypothetical protein
MVVALFSPLNSGLQPVTRHLKSYFGMWTLSGLRLWIFFELSSLGRLAMSMEVLGTQTGTHKLRKEREACLQKTVAGGLL